MPKPKQSKAVKYQIENIGIGKRIYQERPGVFNKGYETGAQKEILIEKLRIDFWIGE